MTMLTLLFLTLISCARTVQPYQAGEESTENFLEVPPSYLESQMDEGLSTQPLSEEKAALNSFLRTLLHGRTARSSFHFQPQRFGRDERSSMVGDGRIHSRGWDSAPQFWSLAVPQRLERKNKTKIPRPWLNITPNTLPEKTSV